MVSVARTVFWANYVDTCVEVYKCLDVELITLDSCLVYILATNGLVNELAELSNSSSEQCFVENVLRVINTQGLVLVSHISFSHF